MGTMADEVTSVEDSSNLKAVDVFTHSSTGFPGAWTEDEIDVLLDAWEEATKSPRPSNKSFDISERVLQILTGKGFRTVEKDEVWKQMNTLRTEYRTYLGLVKIGIPTIKGSCVPQLERILRRQSSKKGRRRRTSTASNQVDPVSEDDVAAQNGTQSQQENTEDENNRSKRVRFQRQNLQRSVRTMITQQRTITEHLQNVFKKIDESNEKIILLLGELVALQKIQDKIEIKEE